MKEAPLDTILARLPAGMSLPVGCWLVARVGEALRERPRMISPTEIFVRADGNVRVGEPISAVPFAYRAPEGLRDGTGDARAAAFSLGAVLVECLTGRSPFKRETDMETRIAVSQEPVLALTGRVAQASPSLDGIAARALVKDIERRLDSPAELATRLDAFLDEELHDVGPAELIAVVRSALDGFDVSALDSAQDFPRPRLRTPAPARAPEPAPAPAPAPAPQSALAEPPTRTTAERFLEAELDLRPEGQRTSAPNKPRFEEDVVRVGDQVSAGAGITESSVTGVRDSGPALRRPALAASQKASARPTVGAALDIDERVVKQQRRTLAQGTLAPTGEEEPESEPNWALRIGGFFVVLLAAAIAYRYAIAPLLSD